MNSLNTVLLEGNLVRDPELSTTPKGTPVCKFAIASNRYFKIDDENQKEVSFFNVTVWAKLAENCAAYLKKGRGVRITGRLKQDRWKGSDGKEKSMVTVIADVVDFKPSFSKISSGENDEEKQVKNFGREKQMKAAVSY